MLPSQCYHPSISRGSSIGRGSHANAPLFPMLPPPKCSPLSMLDRGGSVGRTSSLEGLALRGESGALALRGRALAARVEHWEGW